jgi:hypothetical protein
VVATSVATNYHERSARAAQATGAPADRFCPASTAALHFPEPDPLALAMCMAEGPPALVVSFDPMLEELASALVVSHTPEAAAPTTVHY